ncbi:hypothetical protein C4D60_Mb06t10590 [Musa balbisiana]|uniref:Uncharacterized protein n=1 Tax=Musa balbisiana TaxID=52838 RepID=A0A4V4H3T8_MUSBA|nr:hypothetical protein C4D60_Mb06t10590 [Musa balbisiana]
MSLTFVQGKLCASAPCSIFYAGSLHAIWVFRQVTPKLLPSSFCIELMVALAPTIPQVQSFSESRSLTSDLRLASPKPEPKNNHLANKSNLCPSLTAQSPDQRLASIILLRPSCPTNRSNSSQSTGCRSPSSPTISQPDSPSQAINTSTTLRPKHAPRPLARTPQHASVGGEK